MEITLVDSQGFSAHTPADKELELRQEQGREQRYRERIRGRAAHPPRPDAPRNQFLVDKRLLEHPKPAPYVQLEGVSR